MIDQTEKTKKPTKKDILAALKRDMSAADTLRLDMLSKVETWTNEYDGALYGNEEEGKSKLVSRDIKRQDEWQHAAVKDPFVSDEDIIKCSPVTYEDKLSANQNELVLNYQFTRCFNRYKFMTDAVKLYYKQGTVIAKTSWEYEDEIEEIDIPKTSVDPETGGITVEYEKVKRLKVLKNKPFVEICRLEDIYVDPTCKGDIDNAQFIIHVFESDMSSLKKSGKYKNLHKVGDSGRSENDSSYEDEDETEFRFEDKPRKKLLVHEYWGNYDTDGTGIAVPIVCSWIGDTIIQMQSNPYPDKDLPFVFVANNAIPFKFYGEANAELIGDNQKIATAIKRGFIDNMANSNNNQKGINENSLDTLNIKRFLNGSNFVYKMQRPEIFEGKYNEIPRSAFDILNMTNNETESMLGVKSFSGGIGGASLGSTATAASGTLDAVSVRRVDIVRNIAENFIKPIMRKWASYNSEFLSEEEIVRVTNDEFVPVKRDDLKGLIDIKINVSTSESNEAKVRDLSFILQTGQQTMDPGIVTIMQAEICRLKRMPDLAKRIEEYRPEPDPYVMEMRELEKRKLIAEIAERESRTVENNVDAVSKQQKGQLDAAKTREILSNADLKDLEFTQKASGSAENFEMAKKDHERETAHQLKDRENLTKQ